VVFAMGGFFLLLTLNWIKKSYSTSRNLKMTQMLKAFSELFKDCYKKKSKDKKKRLRFL